MLSQLKGIHFAMEFLTKNQKRLLMTGDGKLESNWDGGFISAEGKDVIVIGVSAFEFYYVFVLTSRQLFSRLVGFTVKRPCTGSMALSDVTARCAVTTSHLPPRNSSISATLFYSPSFYVLAQWGPWGGGLHSIVVASVFDSPFRSALSGLSCHSSPQQQHG